jgi:hypothetical protein
MVSDDMVWSSGASGIAWDADIAIRLRPMANAEAVSIFMDFSLSSRGPPLSGGLKFTNYPAAGQCRAALPVTPDASGSGDANANNFCASNATERVLLSRDECSLNYAG